MPQTAAATTETPWQRCPALAALRPQRRSQRQGQGAARPRHPRLRRHLRRDRAAPRHVRGEPATATARRRSVGQDAVATARPDILDRNGKILATDVKTPSLFAEPRKLIDVDEAEELLTAVMPDLDAKELRERLVSKRGFVWLKREITPKQQQEIHRLGIPGVGFLTENKRVYPNGPVVSHVIGPRQYRQPGHRRHREMAGRAGARRAAHGGACHRPAAAAGAARARSARAVRAARRTDRRAREVQGQGRRPASSSTSTPARSSRMVSEPDYDPNNPREAQRSDRINRLTTGVYEMGSTFKALTVAMALDSGKATLASTFDAQPSAAIRPLRHPRLRADAPLPVRAGNFHLFLEHRRRAHGARRRRRRRTRRS